MDSRGVPEDFRGDSGDPSGFQKETWDPIAVPGGFQRPSRDFDSVSREFQMTSGALQGGSQRGSREIPEGRRSAPVTFIECRICQGRFQDVSGVSGRYHEISGAFQAV